MPSATTAPTPLAKPTTWAVLFALAIAVVPAGATSTPFTVREEMANWLRQVGRHYDKRPVIYTTVDFYQDNELWNVKGYDFWLRSTAGHPAQVYPGQHWTFWQYTGTGAVPGIAGNTDINVFAGSHGQWRQWLAANTR